MGCKGSKSKAIEELAYKTEKIIEIISQDYPPKKEPKKEIELTNKNTELKKEEDLFEIGEVEVAKEEEKRSNKTTVINRPTYAMIENVKKENDKLKEELKKKIDRQN